MKKIKIINNVTSQKYEIDHIEYPAEKINFHVARNSWGLPARDIPKSEEHHTELVIEEYEREIEAEYERDTYELDGEGNPVMEDYTYTDIDGNESPAQRPIVNGTEIVPAVFETRVKLCAEYDLEIIDITEDYEAEQATLAAIADGDKYEKFGKDCIKIIKSVYQTLTTSQKATLKNDWKDIYPLLQTGDIDEAKPLILALPVSYKPLVDLLKNLYRMKNL